MAVAAHALEARQGGRVQGNASRWRPAVLDEPTALVALAARARRGQRRPRLLGLTRLIDRWSGWTSRPAERAPDLSQSLLEVARSWNETCVLFDLRKTPTVLTEIRRIRAVCASVFEHAPDGSLTFEAARQLIDAACVRSHKEVALRMRMIDARLERLEPSVDSRAEIYWLALALLRPNAAWGEKELSLLGREIRRARELAAATKDNLKLLGTTLRDLAWLSVRAKRKIRTRGIRLWSPVEWQERLGTVRTRTAELERQVAAVLAGPLGRRLRPYLA